MESRTRIATFLKAPPPSEGVTTLLRGLEHHEQSVSVDPTYEKERFITLKRMGYGLDGKTHPIAAGIPLNRYHGASARNRNSVLGEDSRGFRKGKRMSALDRDAVLKERKTMKKAAEFSHFARLVAQHTLNNGIVPENLWNECEKINRKHCGSSSMSMPGAAKSSKTTQNKTIVAVFKRNPLAGNLEFGDASRRRLDEQHLPAASRCGQRGVDTPLPWSTLERRKLNELYWELGRGRRGAQAREEHLQLYSSRHRQSFPHRDSNEIKERVSFMWEYNQFKELGESNHWGKVHERGNTSRCQSRASQSRASSSRAMRRTAYNNSRGDVVSRNTSTSERRHRVNSTEEGGNILAQGGNVLSGSQNILSGSQNILSGSQNILAQGGEVREYVRSNSSGAGRCTISRSSRGASRSNSSVIGPCAAANTEIQLSRGRSANVIIGDKNVSEIEVIDVQAELTNESGHIEDVPESTRKEEAYSSVYEEDALTYDQPTFEKLRAPRLQHNGMPSRYMLPYSTLKDMQQCGGYLSGDFIGPLGDRGASPFRLRRPRSLK